MCFEYLARRLFDLIFKKSKLIVAKISTKLSGESSEKSSSISIKQSAKTTPLTTLFLLME
jgi:hypothetical protein